MQLLDGRKYKKEIKRLYKSAFPKEERAPLFFLFYKTKYNNDNKFYAAMENGEFVGFVYTIKKDKMLYIFFLAVDEEKRGKGYGSGILSAVKNMYSDCVLTLEIEDTAITDAQNYEERINRLGFYKKNGYHQLDIHLNETGVDFELLGTAAGVTRDDFLTLMKKYLGKGLFKYIYKKNNF